MRIKCQISRDLLSNIKICRFRSTIPSPRQPSSSRPPWTTKARAEGRSSLTSSSCSPLSPRAWSLRPALLRLRARTVRRRPGPARRVIRRQHHSGWTTSIAASMKNRNTAARCRRPFLTTTCAQRSPWSRQQKMGWRETTWIYRYAQAQGKVQKINLCLILV